MSRLQERLSLLRKNQPSSSQAEGLQDNMHRQKNIDHDHEAEVESWAKLDASIFYFDGGAFVRKLIRVPLDAFHGNMSIGDWLDQAKALSCLCTEKEEVKWNQLLFFDTETTGLGIGAGNVPFMLGFGYYEEDAFVMEQCLLRHPGDEPAVLAYFSSVLQKYTFVVSYNGRTFDWPVLKNRYIMNRIAWMGEHVQHLDFLYPSRSLWRRILPSCSLSSVESERLGFVREGDVPGSLAPTLYFQYMQRKEPALLDGVFVHNAQDLLSLAGLAAYFAGVLCGRIPYAHMEADELFRMAQWLDKIGETERAWEAYGQLLGRAEKELATIAVPLAAVMKKWKRWKDAVRLWQISLAANVEHNISSKSRLESLVELAKYYEHREKQLERALQYTEQAYEYVRNRTRLSRGNTRMKEQLQQLEKRRMRLLGKLQRVQPQKLDHTLYSEALFEQE